ncbi:hypothetical protein JMJ55_18720 [Belnapia sp. T6]|uniref:Response regulatory domain-containing protein n=1 Tax=Belnapia mucosa TaxID=2804532 RepID=A0ABS1V7M6_9PROT|nr:hypothetical protein [Belnapia mucosa]MBL6457372.1 hypothetical protein [Belnapia mucosa]
MPGHPVLAFIVSPDAAVRRSLVLLLEAEAIGTRSFASAGELLAQLPAFRRAPTTRRCVLVEERLPGKVSGLQLAGQLSEADLNLKTIILHAAVRPAAARQSGQTPADTVFADPFHMDALLQEVRTALQLPDAAQGVP